MSLMWWLGLLCVLERGGGAAWHLVYCRWGTLCAWGVWVNPDPQP